MAIRNLSSVEFGIELPCHSCHVPFEVLKLVHL